MVIRDFSSLIERVLAGVYCVHSRESFMHLNIITFNSKFPSKLHTCKIAQKLFSFAVQFYLSFGKILGKISHKRTS